MSEPRIEAKTNKRKAIRIAVWGLTVAVLIFLYQTLRNVGQDVNAFLGGTDSTGYLAAFKEMDDGGSQITVIKPDGTLVEVPGYGTGNLDRDAAWPADGRFLYFVSDRDKGESHVFRWDIGNNRVERKTLDKRTKTAVWFPPSGSPDASRYGIVISGGKVLQLDPVTSEAVQLLPPVGKEIGVSEEGEGSSSQFEMLYSRFGTSFREARWLKDKSAIAAIMRRENGGELLVIQDMSELKAPIPLVAGDRIEIDVSPKDNKLVYSVVNFSFPDPENIPEGYVKNGKIVKPFLNAIGLYDPAASGAQMPIAASQDDRIVFTSPRFAPDGERMLMVVNDVQGGQVKGSSLIVMPAAANGSQGAANVVQGQISQAAWMPDGETLTYVKQDQGQRGVFTISVTGGGEKNWTAGKGNFAFPNPSPRTKSGG